MQTMYYDAFICHASNKFDHKISIIIQNELIKYKIPGSVTRRNGIHKISSVYLDSAISDDEPMDQMVTGVLSQSRFLILVCSPKMMLSFRAQQILDYFWHLKDGENIITMIVEGSPNEVFPSLLRQVKRNGDLFNVEPLAADISAGYPDLHKCIRLLKTEQLRLIAPMIGCTFDDLRRRHYHAVLNRTYISFSVLSALFLYIFISAFLFIRDVDEKEKLLYTQKSEMEQKLKEASEIAGLSSDIAFEYYSKLIEEYEKNGTGGDSLMEMLKTGQPYPYPDTEEGMQQRRYDVLNNAANVATVWANFRVTKNQEKYDGMSYYFDYLFHDEFEWIEDYKNRSDYLYGSEMFFLYVVMDETESLSRGDMIYAIENRTFDNVADLENLINSYHEYYSFSETPMITVSVLHMDTDGTMTEADYSIDLSRLTWIII